MKERIPKVKRLVPPLKDVPDEIYEDSANDSDYKLSRIETETKVREIMKDLGPHAYRRFESAYRKIAVHDPKKAKKLVVKNAKLSLEDREEPKILDVWLTETSLVEGFERLLGAKCDIFAKMLYIKASKCLDYCKLTIVDFYNIVYPLMVRFSPPLIGFPAFSMKLQRSAILQRSVYWTPRAKEN